MQVLLSLPGECETGCEMNTEEGLSRKVCGVPLLVRAVATAMRAGGTRVLLVYPASLPPAALRNSLNSRLLASAKIETLVLPRTFDPDNPSDWRAIENRLESRFLWLPWNYVVDKRSLARLIAAGEHSRQGARFEWPTKSGTPNVAHDGPHKVAASEQPIVVVKSQLKSIAASAAGSGEAFSRYSRDASLDAVPVPDTPGILVDSRQGARRAERHLVRRSGKDSDGIYSKFNRMLSRPFVRWLSKTPVTPNIVSFGGLIVSFLAAYWYAQGHWSAYVLGGVLYFVSVLFDEMDGMLARVTFRDSAFGTWLETFMDYAGYALLYGGMAIGLYRRGGVLWLWLGGLVLFGAVTSFFVVAHLRKVSTEPDMPQEHFVRLCSRLEADSGNVVSRFGRLAIFSIRKAAFGHFVLVFSLLGGLKVLFLLSVLGANLVWILGLYFHRFFRPAASPNLFATSVPSSLGLGSGSTSCV